MAKILFSFFQNVIDGDYKKIGIFYEQLSEEFRKNGNEVLLLNMALHKDNWLSEHIYQEDRLFQEVKEFAPDLVIAFNNQIFPRLLEAVDCPIALWTADELMFYQYKNLMKSNLSRYMILSTKKDNADLLDFGFAKEQIHFVKLATSVEKEDVVQDKGISFIGSLFGVNRAVYEEYTNNECREAYINFLKNKEFSYIKNFRRLSQLGEDDVMSVFDIRAITLAYLADLDLHIYGRGCWVDFSYYMPQLYICYHHDSIYSNRQNADIYNSSKICISISHPQAQGKGYPWRIMDIMASNGCLVSQYSSMLAEETKGWVEIPMYYTPEEARGLCISLLNDDKRRREIVEASQAFVEKNGRWCDRLKQFESIFNLKFLNNQADAKTNILYFEPKKEVEEKKVGKKSEAKRS